MFENNPDMQFTKAEDIVSNNTSTVNACRNNINLYRRLYPAFNYKVVNSSGHDNSTISVTKKEKCSEWVSTKDLDVNYGRFLMAPLKYFTDNAGDFTVSFNYNLLH